MRFKEDWPPITKPLPPCPVPPQPPLQYLNGETIRVIESVSIRYFLEKNREYLKGRVLDFGCGKPGTCREPQPYKDLVEGEYFPYDVGDKQPQACFYDTILCTQVIQYIPDPLSLLWQLRDFLKPSGGHLVLTYPTCWDEVEANDYWRFTKSGMLLLLAASDFKILHHERRAEINLNGFKFPLGYGVIAQAS